MGSSPIPGNLLLGRGKAYFDRLDTNGASTGWRFMGNATEVTYQNNDDTKQMYSSAEASSPLLDEVVSRRTPELGITLTEFDRPNMALALMGDEAEFTQSTATVVAEVLSTTPVVDRHYGTAKRRISSVVVKRGATTIPAGEYDIVSAEAGIIYLHASAPTFTGATGSLTIDYTAAAITAGSGPDQVRIGTASFIQGAFLFLPDPARGPKWEIRLWRVSMSQDGTIGLISDDYGNFKLKGRVLSDAGNHPTEPFGRAIRLP